MGKWKNFDELEEELNIQELTLIVEQKQKDDYNMKKFMAAMQGVDLDKNVKDSEKERLEAVHRRAQARLLGGEEALERKELTDLGFSVETE